MELLENHTKRTTLRESCTISVGYCVCCICSGWLLTVKVGCNASGPNKNWPVCLLILRKIIKIGAIRCQILRLNCTVFAFRWDCAPDLNVGAQCAPPYAPLVVSLAYYYAECRNPSLNVNLAGCLFSTRPYHYSLRYMLRTQKCMQPYLILSNSALRTYAMGPDAEFWLSHTRFMIVCNTASGHHQCVFRAVCIQLNICRTVCFEGPANNKANKKW